jgi:hypothetical protein
MIPRPRLKPRFTIPLENQDHAARVMQRLKKLLDSEKVPAMGQGLTADQMYALRRVVDIAAETPHDIYAELTPGASTAENQQEGT